MTPHRFQRGTFTFVWMMHRRHNKMTTSPKCGACAPLRTSIPEKLRLAANQFLQDSSIPPPYQRRPHQEEYGTLLRHLYSVETFLDSSSLKRYLLS